MPERCNLKPEAVAPPLLAWYHQNRRVLPFRENPLPYHVWVSEIMLQQTRMETVLPYYHRFIQALPDIPALAACDEEKLHKLWEGLGYYSRARNLQKAAIQVVEHYGGQLPANYEALLGLPGIGAYTAGAIASIAYGLPHVAVDGNVLRVFARLLACPDDILLPGTKKNLGEVVQKAQPPSAPGDFNQAVMELGALVCLPGSPDCGGCPLQGICCANQQGIAGQLPLRVKPQKQRLVDVTLLVVKKPGAVLLQQRPQNGLLAGLWQPPLVEKKQTEAEVKAWLSTLVPGAKLDCALPGARHVFSHRIWEMGGWLCLAPEGAKAPKGFVFATAEQWRHQLPIPGAFKAYLPFFE